MPTTVLYCAVLSVSSHTHRAPGSGSLSRCTPRPGTTVLCCRYSPRLPSQPVAAADMHADAALCRVRMPARPRSEDPAFQVAECLLLICCQQSSRYANDGSTDTGWQLWMNSMAEAAAMGWDEAFVLPKPCKRKRQPTPRIFAPPPAPGPTQPPLAPCRPSYPTYICALLGSLDLCCLLQPGCLVA